MDDLVRSMRNNGGAILTVLVCLGVVVTCVIVCILSGDRKTEAWVRERACSIGPLGMSHVRQRTYHRLPFGLVRSCRLLGYDPRLFNDVDASTWLLLETDAGLVVVRVDYFDLDQGFYWYADAVEVSPGQVSGGMSEEEIHRHSRDVARRGGVSGEPWRLVSGV